MARICMLSTWALSLSTCVRACVHIQVEQLACIMEVLGVPPRKLVAECSRRKAFFDSTGNPRIVPNSRGKRQWPLTQTNPDPDPDPDLDLDPDLDPDPKPKPINQEARLSHACLQLHGYG